MNKDLLFILVTCLVIAMVLIMLEILLDNEGSDD